MTGLLVPDRYVLHVPTLDDLLVASIIWGFTLAAGVFAASKAVRQTLWTWRRSHRASAYIIMVWSEWAASSIIGLLSWLFIRGVIEPSFWIYLAFLCLWVVQIQCSCGIIVNRIGLLIPDRRTTSKIRWTVAGILGIINVSVFCIWIPAQLQISQTYVDINRVWDRMEKAIFCVVDASLNFYFIYLVRTRLIANGLNKYLPVFRFNCCIVIFSISLDILLIGSMSIPNGIVYVQFHPLVYMLKLHIEMKMAELIVQVVTASNDANNLTHQPSAQAASHWFGRFNRRHGSPNRRSGLAAGAFSGQCHFSPETYQARVEGPKPKSRDASGQNVPAIPSGIVKTMHTSVTTSRGRDEEETGSTSESSTGQIKDCQ